MIVTTSDLRVRYWDATTGTIYGRAKLYLTFGRHILVYTGAPEYIQPAQLQSVVYKNATKLKQDAVELTKNEARQIYHQLFSGDGWGRSRHTIDQAFEHHATLIRQEAERLQT